MSSGGKSSAAKSEPERRGTGARKAASDMRFSASISRIGSRFAELRAAGSAALIPFFACGYPDMETTRLACLAARDAGADIIELGIPFSDPIADGPTIQAAFASALNSGFRVRDAFALVGRLRGEGFCLPIVAMVSYSLIFRMSEDRFAAEAADAGFDGIISPDLPLDAGSQFADICRRRGLDMIQLVAPTTPAGRRAGIVRAASGFVYYISVAGITGERDALPADLAANVRSLKRISNLPICVGFGIGRPEQAAAAARVADGVIVGSALVRKIGELASSGATADRMAGPLAADIRRLAKAAHGREATG